MKVTASNQTVFLAGESARTASSSLSSGSSVLERVTILAARPDSVVYLRADYAPAGTPADQAFDSSIVATVPKRAPSSPTLETDGTDPAGTAVILAPFAGSVSAANKPARRDGGLSAYLRPTEQYALMQRMAEVGRAPSRIDVHA